MSEILEHWLELLRLEEEAQRARFRSLSEGKSYQEQVAEGVLSPVLEPHAGSWDGAGRYRQSFGCAHELGDRFRRGQPVEVIPVDDEEGPARGVIEGFRRGELSVSFSEPPALPSKGLRLKLSVDEVTMTRARKAIDLASKDPKRSEGLHPQRIRQLLEGSADALGDAQSASAPSTTSHEFGGFPLNELQGRALKMGLECSSLALVHGPPGTGKTRVLVALACEEASRGSRILATADSNDAVDNLAEQMAVQGLRVVRIGHPSRSAERLRHLSLEHQVQSHPSYGVVGDMFREAQKLFAGALKTRDRGRSADRRSQARDAFREARALRREAREQLRGLRRAILEQAEVVAATCATLGGRDFSDEEAFDICLHDEATQSMAPLALWPMLRSKRIFMAGDHRQLPPTVISEEAAAKGLGQSLFEQLIQAYPDHALMLREQYRMQPEIMRFVSDSMYQGQLEASRRLPPIQPSITNTRLVLDTAGAGWDEERDPTSGSRRNLHEAKLASLHFAELVEAGLGPDEVGIIAPYRAQVQAIQHLLEEAGLSAEVSTVDSFQGREKQAIVLSMVRSNAEGAIGFLAEVRRTNVAISRAKQHLCIIGDSATLGAHPYYAALFEDAQSHGEYHSIWSWPAAAELL